MSTSKKMLKVTLHSATISTFLWWGNSDPIDAEDTFEDSMASLYQGTLCLMPHKPLDSGFTYPIDSSWTLIHDYSELNVQEKKEIINVPLKSMVNVANKTVEKYIQSLSESERKELKK